MELDKGEVKEYFKKEKTVSGWWDPEERPGLFRDLYVEQRRILAELFDSKGKTILDAGTGKGRFAIDFAKAGAMKVYATDLSVEMLTIAERRAKERGVGDRIAFQAMDVEKLDFADNYFDAVCCMETFVHLPSPQSAMAELARVVKPGGTVICSVTLPMKKWYVNVTRISNLDQLFEWIFTPVYQSRIYQGGMRRILRRHSMVGRPLAGDYFSGLFTNSHLSIQRQIYLGHPKAPHFLLISASK